MNISDLLMAMLVGTSAVIYLVGRFFDGLSRNVATIAKEEKR